MRFPSSLQLALGALPIHTLAVSLVDFPPRVSNLPSACNTVYTASISGCTSSDFSGSNGCSTSCVQTLEDLVPYVQNACGDDNLSGENVLVAFLAGQGPESLCSNANAVLSSLSSSAAPSTTATPSTSQTPTPTPTTTSVSSSSLTAVLGGTSTTSTTAQSSSSTQAATSTSSAAVKASSTTSSAQTTNAVASSTSETRFASSTSSAHSTQATSTDRSGGGSPFDNQNSATLSQPLSIVATCIFSTAMLILMMR